MQKLGVPVEVGLRKRDQVSTYFFVKGSYYLHILQDLRHYRVAAREIGGELVGVMLYRVARPDETRPHRSFINFTTRTNEQRLGKAE